LHSEKEFTVNEYITLKLEGERSNIYVKGRLFNQCKFLLLNIPVDKISSFDEIQSIDEAAEKLDRSLEGRETGVFKIPPEVEFWGHCSNLQVWMETDYDTRLLHRNIAFPLLRKLSQIGDPTAKKVFKKEIINRFADGNDTVNTFLIEEGYLESLNHGDRKLLLIELFENENFRALEFLESKRLINLREFSKDESIELLFDLNYDFNDYIQQYLKQSSNSGRLLHSILGNIIGSIIENTEDLPQKLFRRGISQIFIYGNNEVREYLTPEAGSGKFNYMEIALRNNEECTVFFKEIFENKDIKALRFLDSHNLLYFRFYHSKNELKEFIFDSDYNYQEFFQSIVDNEIDFRTIAIHFMKTLVEKEDSRAAEILKQEIVKRLKNTTLVDLMRLISPKDLDIFTNEELRLISFKSLEKEPFLKKCSENSSVFSFVFSLIKVFIERGFEQEKNLLKSIFIREFDKPDSYLLKRLISEGYMEVLSEIDKKEMVGHLIKIGNLNIFLDLHNKDYINLFDFQNDLLTPNTELNKRLKESFENPDQIRKFALPLLEWFSKNGTKDAQKFFDHQIITWIKFGGPEIISFLKEDYNLREYFQNDMISRFINDGESQFLKNVSKGLIDRFHMKTCFELFEMSLDHLDRNQRKVFIDTFVQKIKYRGIEIPYTAFQGIQGLLMLGAFDEIRNLLMFKGYCEEHELNALKNQLKHYNPFPSSYQSSYDGYEDEHEYTYHSLQPLILFMDSREVNSLLHLNDDEFNALHKFIEKSSEIIAPIYVLNNFSETTIHRIADYLIDKLNEETNPQSFRQILEFIKHYVISLKQLKTEDFFFRVISSYNDFKKTNEKYSFNGFFIDYIFQIRETLGDRFLPALMKLFGEDISVLCSYFYESLNPEYNVSGDMRKMALRTLVLLVKSRNKETLSLLIKEQVLISLEEEWLHEVFNEMEKTDVEYFLFGLSQLSITSDRYYNYYENTSNETFLIHKFKESLDTRSRIEKMSLLTTTIELVLTKLPDLFQFLVEAEFFEEISLEEFQRLFAYSNNLFVKALLLFMKKNIWRNEDFDKFYDQVINHNLSFSDNKQVQKLYKFYLEMLLHFDTGTYDILPAIQFLKKFGEGAIDITFRSFKSWLNDEEYPHYDLFSWIINSGFLEIMNRDTYIKKLQEIKSELIEFLKELFKTDSYRTGNHALAFVRIYQYGMDDPFVFNLLLEVPINVRENIKTSILRLVEYNDRKGYVDYGKLDSALKASSLQLLNMLESDLDVEEIKFVTLHNMKHYVIKGRLDLSKKDIHDIEEIKGLELLSDLKELDLSSNYITEIKGFESLVNLESLNLDATLNEYKLVISEIKGLDTLIKLKNLSIQYQCAITEMKGLEKLVYLERLMLNYVNISELKNLDHLKDLKFLSLEGNNISEIKGLKNLVNLIYLNLRSNQITEIKGLDKLKNLESLYLSRNKINVLEELENLRNLTHIDVANQTIGFSNKQISLENSSGYFAGNGPKYVAKCLRSTNRKIEGTLKCPNTECDAIVYSNWEHCPMCYKPIIIEKKKTRI